MHLLDLEQHPHNRYNPLKDEWVLVCPHRLSRPWLGEIQKGDSLKNTTVSKDNEYNYLAPGAKRINNKVNEDYTTTYVFENDFPALLPSISGKNSNLNYDVSNANDLFKTAPASGKCRVMCFSPLTEQTLALMSTEGIKNVINQWVAQTKELGQSYSWVQIFENKGAAMGCSNPHPHCQIWASNFIPNEARVKNRNQLIYYLKHAKQKPLLIAYCQQEISKKVRMIDENASWVTLVPFWAMWPYEVMVLPKRHVLRFPDLTEAEIKGAPTGEYYGEDMAHWQFHGMYYPPLLRSANIKKFMVGYELLAQPQRDFTPEKAAEMLRSANSEVHYTAELRNN